VCRSGHGGDGEIVEAGRGKWVNNNKYHAGANQSKKIWLPASKHIKERAGGGGMLGDGGRNAKGRSCWEGGGHAVAETWAGARLTAVDWAASM
jgi:hypothetical protein